MARTLTGCSHPERILRLGMLGEKAFFARPELYDMVMLNANLVQAFTAGVAAFLVERLKADKPFIIDPMTYAFGLPLAAISKRTKVPDGYRLDLKQTFRALADSYEGIIAARAGQTPLLPGDFEDDAVQKETCQKTLSYQAGHLKASLTPDVLKYLDDSALQPAALLCPYFHFSAATMADWLPTNISLIRCACNTDCGLDAPRLAVICISRELLQSDQYRTWLDQYVGLDVAGYCLWVVDFPEADATDQELANLRDVVSKLSREGERFFYKIYGGYLSALMWHSGLSGFSYGPGYGEDRNISPVGGGLPQPKFYLPGLHQRMDALDVAGIVPATKAQFMQQICQCSHCKSVIGENAAAAYAAAYMETDTTWITRSDGSGGREQAYAAQSTKVNSTFHYLAVRSLEVAAAADTEPAHLKIELTDKFAKYQKTFGLDMSVHLRQWAAHALP